MFLYHSYTYFRCHDFEDCISHCFTLLLLLIIILPSSLRASISPHVLTDLKPRPTTLFQMSHCAKFSRLISIRTLAITVSETLAAIPRVVPIGDVLVARQFPSVESAAVARGGDGRGAGVGRERRSGTAWRHGGDTRPPHWRSVADSLSNCLACLLVGAPETTLRQVRPTEMSPSHSPSPLWTRVVSRTEPPLPRLR